MKWIKHQAAVTWKLIKYLIKVSKLDFLFIFKVSKTTPKPVVGNPKEGPHCHQSIDLVTVPAHSDDSGKHFDLKQNHMTDAIKYNRFKLSYFTTSVLVDFDVDDPATYNNQDDYCMRLTQT